MNLKLVASATCPRCPLRDWPAATTPCSSCSCCCTAFTAGAASAAGTAAACPKRVHMVAGEAASEAMGSGCNRGQGCTFNPSCPVWHPTVPYHTIALTSHTTSSSTCRTSLSGTHSRGQAPLNSPAYLQNSAALLDIRLLRVAALHLPLAGGRALQANLQVGEKWDGCKAPCKKCCKAPCSWAYKYTACCA